MMSPAMTKGAEESKDKSALPGDGVDPAIPAMATHEEQFYSGLEAVKIINLPPEERMRRILAMPPPELIAFRRRLSRAGVADAAGGLTPVWRETLAAKNGGRFAQHAQNPQVKQALKDRGLNENYARELMELHTLGVQCEVSADRPVSMLDKACGQGYTQQDVTQVAKVLTGWTIDQP